MRQLLCSSVLKEGIALQNHISPAVLSRFFAGEAANEEARAVVAHLITGCPLCTSRSAAMPLMAPPPEPPEAYDLAIERAFAAVSRPAPDKALELHNRLLALLGSGRLVEALCCFTENLDWLWDNGSALDRVKLLGIEGRIHAGLGHLNVAESSFRESKWRSAAAGISGHEALVTLNLASILEGQGRTTEAAELAQEALQVFARPQAGDHFFTTLDLLSEDDS
jgi:tetratricopeptide (TPR) repeat protein